MPHDTRDNLVDFVNAWADKTEIPVCRFLGWIGLGASKFHDWIQRYGKVNEHNAWVPRHGLHDWTFAFNRRKSALALYAVLVRDSKSARELP